MTQRFLHINSLIPHYYYYPHFIGREIKAEKLSNLPKVTQAASGRIWILSQMVRSHRLTQPQELRSESGVKILVLLGANLAWWDEGLPGAWGLRIQIKCSPQGPDSLIWILLFYLEPPSNTGAHGSCRLLPASIRGRRERLQVLLPRAAHVVIFN